MMIKKSGSRTRHGMIVLFLVLGSFFVTAQQKASIQPFHLRCEYLINPEGIDEPSPRLSWTLEATNLNAFGQKQVAYKIVVATALHLLNEKADSWNSGWVNSSAMQQIIYAGKPLQSNTTYYWKVWVKDEKGIISTSSTAHWSTGLLQPSDFLAEWIGSNELFDPTQKDCSIRDPWFRKNVQLQSLPERAVFFLASIGYHELYVNGKKVTEDVLSPAVSDHTKRARYIAYNIAPYLRKGSNTIGVWLGTSWSVFGPYITPGKPATPVFWGQAMLSSKEGKEIVITTDSSWKTYPSPNRLLGTWDFAKMGGELYNANEEELSWNRPGFNDKHWQQATVYHPGVKLSAQLVEANRQLREINPVSILRNADGSYRVDMGVNFAGFTQIAVNGHPGDTIHFLFSEREQEVMTFNLYSAYVIGKTGKGVFKNRFNYSSGRWITIKGLQKVPQLQDIKGWLVRTNYKDAASFSCADSLQNWIYETVKWTYENLSLGGYVVDCPQRERLGYGGDAHATIETGFFNYHTAAFYTKWMQDWQDVQGTESIVGNMYDTSFARKQLQSGRHFQNGTLPHTAPTYSGGGGPAWGGIVVTLPWYFYLQYKDTQILERNFSLIQDWLTFLDGHTQGDLLQRFGGPWDFLGDWLWPNATAEGMNNDKPENSCFNNSYRAYNLLTAAKIAHTLGKTAIAVSWEKQAARVQKAIHAKFYNQQDYSYADGSMANLAAALLAEVPPAHLRDSILDRLEKEIMIHKKGHIHAGITGGALLFKLLRALGRDDLLFSMTTQTAYPSWGYMKQNDATTLWEMWEKDLPGHSLLHSSYLFPGAWYIDGVAGIRQDTAAPGFQQFIIRPPSLPVEQMPWAKASFQSPAGLITVAWERNKERLLIDCTVPPNTKAILQLKEKAVRSASGTVIPVKGFRRGYWEFELEAGRYHLTASESE